MGLFDFFSKKKEPAEIPFTAKSTIPTEKLMTSQLAALYLSDRNITYRDVYMNKLSKIGVPMSDAQKLFQFDCDVIKRFGKAYLTDPDFTKAWFFGLKQPHFQLYPKTQPDILKERSLVFSELLKLADEAEWHFWNSHERDVSDEVWAEIYAWRLGGKGQEFAMSYFEMMSKELGVSMDSLAALSNEQGSHLSRYKWG